MGVVVATTDKCKSLIKDAKDNKNLKTLIVMDGENCDQALVDAGAGAGITVVKFSDVEAAGAAAPAPENRHKTDDIATICYTSGTTGNPKVGFQLVYLSIYCRF